MSRSALFATILLLSTAASCGGEDVREGDAVGPPVVGAARLEVSREGAVAVEDTAFAGEATAAFAALPPLAEAAGSGGGRVDVTGRLEIWGGEGGLVLRARLAGIDLGVPIEAGVAASGSAGSPAATREIVRKGLADLSRALGSLIRIATGGEEAWIRALGSAEPDEQATAAALLGRGRVRAAVPPLAMLLDDPRVRVVEAAADALAAIGDERAVPFLIGAIREGDPRSETRAIEAMGRIGGDEARAYLEMTAVGHEDPEVRRLSRAALEVASSGEGSGGKSL